jgi:hypothetical protein
LVKLAKENEKLPGHEFFSLSQCTRVDQKHAMLKELGMRRIWNMILSNARGPTGAPRQADAPSSSDHASPAWTPHQLARVTGEVK